VAARSHKLKLSAEAKSALESAAAFGRSRLEQQRHQIERLRSERPEPVITLPRLTTPRIGPAELSVLADALVEADPS
jgi:arsenite/tail-anchored protein-transporting ATPase